MKPAILSIGCLLGTLSFISPSIASEIPAVPPSAEAVLDAMESAGRTASYELSYIVIKQNSIEPIRFRRMVQDDDSVVAHLTYLSGPAREVIQRGDRVSYYEPGIEPYTISSNKMVASLPPVMLTDMDSLSKSYDFIPMGRAREAGVICNVVRIAPKDGQRYSYLLWVDENSHLVMRADLLDRDGEPLEQYRVVSHTMDPSLEHKLTSLEGINYPPVVPLPARTKADLNWQVQWLPHGFESIAGNRHRLINSDRPVESQLYTDGLFSFSVYVAEADNFTMREQLVRQGRRTLHSHAIQGFEVSVVGDIPPSTAKLIAESVKFTPKVGTQ
ncbi:sigma-E factor regulatory protein RseB [Thaumasiovibrio subtropicus]|uniref:sigma-E factor regulatory protein RseB n=1 Tax=Thaumasiovibrio subtropicus TaxID=1891207 RepID=UPI0039C8F793